MQKQWIVKSSGKVIGPFSQDEVSQLIRDRKVSIIDEVKDPNNRWKYIREHPIFLDIVRSMKESKPSPRIQQDERTDTMAIAPMNLTPQTSDNSSLDALLDRKKEEQVVTQVKIKTQQIIAKRKSEEKKSNTLPLMIGLIVLCISSGLGFWWMHQQKNKDVKLTYEEYIQNARKHSRLGNSELALVQFQKALEQGPLSASDTIDYALALISLNSYVEGSQVLQSQLPSQLTPPLKAKSQAAFALAAMKESNWSEVEKNFALINQSGLYKYESYVNRGLISALKGEYTRAAFELQREYLANKKEILFLAGWAYSIFSLPQNEAIKIEELKIQLKEASEKSSAWPTEIYILYLRSLLETNNKTEALEVLKKILDHDLFSSRDHIKSSLIERKFLSPDIISKYCLESATLFEAKWSQALISICAGIKSDWGSAINSIQEARKTDPKEFLFLGPQAFYFVQAGRLEEARVILKIAPYGSLQLPMILRARVCEIENNLGCAFDVWKRLAEIAPSQIAAIAGVAAGYQNQGQAEFAKEYLNRGLSIAPWYRPFVELNTPQKGTK